MRSFDLGFDLVVYMLWETVNSNHNHNHQITRARLQLHNQKSKCNLQNHNSVQFDGNSIQLVSTPLYYTIPRYPTPPHFTLIPPIPPLHTTLHQTTPHHHTIHDSRTTFHSTRKSVSYCIVHYNFEHLFLSSSLLFTLSLLFPLPHL